MDVMKRIKKMIIVFFTVLTVVCFFHLNTKTVYAEQTYSYKYKKVKVKKEGFIIFQKKTSQKRRIRRFT